jgi:hypothetical protein
VLRWKRPSRLFASQNGAHEGKTLFRQNERTPKGVLFVLAEEGFALMSAVLRSKKARGTFPAQHVAKLRGKFALQTLHGGEAKKKEWQ